LSNQREFTPADMISYRSTAPNVYSSDDEAALNDRDGRSAVGTPTS
jgi:hypothetical protein